MNAEDRLDRLFTVWTSHVYIPLPLADFVETSLSLVEPVLSLVEPVATSPGINLN